MRLESTDNTSLLGDFKNKLLSFSIFILECPDQCGCVFTPVTHADKVVTFNQTVIPVWLLLVGEPIGDVRVGEDGAPSWDTRVSTIGFTSLQVFDNWNSKVYLGNVLLLTNLGISIQLTNNYSVVVVGVFHFFCTDQGSWIFNHIF